MHVLIFILQEPIWLYQKWLLKSLTLPPCLRLKKVQLFPSQCQSRKGSLWCHQIAFWRLSMWFYYTTSFSFAIVDSNLYMCDYIGEHPNATHNKFCTVPSQNLIQKHIRYITRWPAFIFWCVYWYFWGFQAYKTRSKALKAAAKASSNVIMPTGPTHSMSTQ